MGKTDVVMVWPLDSGMPSWLVSTLCPMDVTEGWYWGERGCCCCWISRWSSTGERLEQLGWFWAGKQQSIPVQQTGRVSSLHVEFTKLRWLVFGFCTVEDWWILPPLCTPCYICWYFLLIRHFLYYTKCIVRNANHKIILFLYPYIWYFILFHCCTTLKLDSILKYISYVQVFATYS